MLWRKLIQWVINLIDPIPSFDIVDRGETIQSSFLIKEGEFQGVEYLVGKVRLPTDTDNTLHFVTQLLQDPEGKALEDADGSFTNIAGRILVQHLENEHNDYRNWLYKKS